MVLGGVAASLMAEAGLLFWQTAANQDAAIPAPPPPEPLSDTLPEAGAGAPAFGPAPPTPPEAPKASREEVRFNRYDRNRDELFPPPGNDGQSNQCVQSGGSGRKQSADI